MHWQTHTVFNQPIPLNNSNLYLSDGALCEAVTREGAGWDSDFLASIGQQLGTAESLELGRLANVNPPELLRYDAQGRRLDDVRFHPAWHLLMQALCTNRVHNLAWEEDARSGAFVARAARFMLHAQVEAGSLCPITMTFAATPLLLQMLPAPFQDWTTPLLSDRYDSHLLPGGQKRGLLIGMGMTEKQGGSDVMSNTTRAERLEDGSYRLVGHKWFFSVPQSDAHLVLAQTTGGLSCFFVPRFLPDGQRNAIRLERLKDKLGNRSNASCEVEFQDAIGWLLGQEGEGIRLILKMGGMTHLLPGGQKRGLLIGMGMTEKQGGSDVMSNTTRAERLEDGSYRLVGHKWFFSVPQSDAHLVLAQTTGGLSCFFVPRFLPDGQRNAIRLERLKDKLGNRSNASCEVEFQDAIGWLLGQEGEGIRLILKMGGMTRFDCALGSHAMMRRAFSLAIYHAHQRHVFGNPLIQQPLMRHVLSRMALQLEGQTALLFRLARAWDRRADAKEALWARLFTPAAKFVICKRGMPFVAEAMEVLGGIGYCEESELPRLYREMPVNSIWEGSGNIMCLDVLRVLNKQAGVYDLLSEAFVEVKGQDRYFDRAVRRLQQQLRKPAEELGREITHQLFLLGCGAQMLKYASPPMAQAWCQVMLDTRGGVRLSEQIQNDLLLRATGGVCV